jgi:hypothetical protein
MAPWVIFPVAYVVTAYANLEVFNSRVTLRGWKKDFNTPKVTM